MEIDPGYSLLRSEPYAPFFDLSAVLSCLCARPKLGRLRTAAASRPKDSWAILATILGECGRATLAEMIYMFWTLGLECVFRSEINEN